MGFKFKKADGRRVIMEKPSIAAKRATFLREYMDLRNKHNFVWLDETWIFHKGSMKSKSWQDIDIRSSPARGLYRQALHCVARRRRRVDRRMFPHFRCWLQNGRLSRTDEWWKIYEVVVLASRQATWGDCHRNGQRSLPFHTGIYSFFLFVCGGGGFLITGVG